MEARPAEPNHTQEKTEKGKKAFKEKNINAYCTVDNPHRGSSDVLALLWAKAESFRKETWVPCIFVRYSFFGAGFRQP